MTTKLNTAQLIEETHVNRLIGPLMRAIRHTGVRRISVVTWDSEEISREVACVLAAGFSKQLEQACAAVFSEGLRVRVEEQDGYFLITLPEVEATATGAEVRSDFPLQFIAGASLKDIDTPSLPKVKLTMSADAHLLVVPREGMPRHLFEKVQEMSRRINLRWLGIVLTESGEFHA